MKYNFNLDKSTSECFGFTSPDESWETKNNTSNRVLFKSDDFTTTYVDENGDTVPEWYQDYESRYPEDYYTETQLKEFTTWVKSTDTTAATDEALDASVTYDGVTYTTDSAAYRLAKFKDEAWDYMEEESTLFYYLFTELFLMVDSRVKNSFPSFIGSEVSA